MHTQKDTPFKRPTTRLQKPKVRSVLSSNPMEALSFVLILEEL